MKKLLTLAAIAAFALVLTGCPKDPDPVTPKSDPIETPDTPEEETKTGIIIGETVYKFADLTISENYGNSALIKKGDDGTLTVTAGSWDAFNIVLPETIDITGKKIAITAKVAADYVQGGNLFKLIFAESDDNQSEITSNDNGNVGWCNPLTEDFATYTGSDVWEAYQKTAADLSKIGKIIINPQSGAGDITIQSIEFVD